MSDTIKKWHELNESGAFKKTKDPVVEKVLRQFEVRSAVGIDKYGKTLHENQLSLIEWLEHTKQELMDAILYIERAKDELQKSSIQ